MIIAHENTKRTAQCSQLDTNWFTPRIGTISVLQADHDGLIAEMEKKRLAHYSYQYSYGTESRTWNGKNLFKWLSMSGLCIGPMGQKFETFSQLYSQILQLISLH